MIRRCLLVTVIALLAVTPLYADTAKLYVKCNVKAVVSVNGTEAGETGKLIKDVPSGKVTVTVTAEGYEEYSKEIDLRPGEINKIEVTLKKAEMAKLLVKCNVKAKVFVNGVKAGDTGKTISDLPEGKAKVKVSAAGYEDFEKEVVLTKGKTCRLEVTLKEPVALVDIITDPPGARVIIDKVEEGDVTPLTVSVKPGKHDLLIVLEGHKDIVMKGEEFTDGKTIEKKMEEGKSRWREPKKHKKKSRPVRLYTDFSTGEMPGWLEAKTGGGGKWSIEKGMGVLDLPQREQVGVLLVTKRFDISKPFRLRVRLTYPGQGGTRTPFSPIEIRTGDEVFESERGSGPKPVSYSLGLCTNSCIRPFMSAPGGNAESIVRGKGPAKMTCYDKKIIRTSRDEHSLQNNKVPLIWEMVSKNRVLTCNLYDANERLLLTYGPINLAPCVKHDVGKFRILLGDVFAERTKGRAEYDWLEFEFPEGM
ncbi:MAG: PEGA domain-containing protein [Planctomycetota bacterium]|jgi:uncharacterized cupredoxin-like copper-binding protein